MFRTNIITRAIYLASISAVSLPFFTTTAHAQSEEEIQSHRLERIAVTGSRIKRIGELSPTPVTVITGASITDAGITNVGELLNEMPSSVTGISPETSNNTIFASGLNQTSLRNLGANRTLVLVNGRRYVGSSPGNSAVDLNNIPTAMVERVEVTTGGASAIYGSDAVAGVVNIITKKTFEGFEFDASTSRPQQKGGEESFYSMTFGNSSDDSDFIANLTYATQEQIRGSQRDFIRQGPIAIDNPLNTGNADGIPGKVLWDKRGTPVLYSYGKNGTFVAGGDRYAFNADGSIRAFDLNGGTLYPQVPNSTNNNRYLMSERGAGDGYSVLDHTYLRTPLERLNLSANFSKDLNDEHRFIFESTVSNTKAYGQSSPAFFVLELDPTNPLLAQSARDFFQSKGITSPITNTYLATELGSRKYDQNRTLMRTAFGLEGSVTDTWEYEAYIQKGHVDAESKWFGEVFEQRFLDAIQATTDANGDIVCKDEVARANGCVPLNIYGSGRASQEALNWVRTDAMRDATLDQDVAMVALSGEIYDLPAGPLSSAFSVEHRNERSSTQPDPAMRAGLLFNNKSDPMRGEFDVTEASAEFSIPLVADVDYIQNLTAETAFRTMDYSTTGRDNAWKISLNYELNDDWRFRLNRSKSVRAPNIGELFNPKGQTYSSIQDPCQQLRIDNAGQYRENIERNCRADGIPQGWSPTQDWINGGTKPGFIVGNQELDSERAYDVTAGFIYTPQSVEGFSFVVDYWTFHISDMVSEHTAQNIIDYCYQLEDLNNPYCGLIERDDVTRNITNYYLKPLNSASAKLSGYDIEANYKLDLSSVDLAGELDLRIVATYTENWEQNTTGRAADNRNYAGQYDYFRWKGRFTANYVLEDMSFVLNGTYIDDSVSDRNAWTEEVHNYNEIGSYTSWDLTSRYNLSETLQLRAGVLNLFDRQPVFNPVVYTTPGEHYDVLGRRFTVGANIKF